MAFDPLSLALSKGYTEATAEGMGAVQGKPGPAGKDGVTPDIQVGTVTTLSPGQSATVTRRQDSQDSAPVFDFGIPQGEKGEPGTGGGGGSGTADHRALSHRDEAGQHPISAIDGLPEALERIPGPVEPLTNSDLEEILK